MIKTFVCDNKDCKRYNIPWVVKLRIDGWFYEMPSLWCLFCGNSAKVIPNAD